jgi:DNA-binding NarL/FixJ family response regulator
MTAASPIRLLIVDDDPLVRAGLVMMLGGASDIQIVAEAADGCEVVPMVTEHAPDVVLMDIRMPQVDGLAATEQVRGMPNPPEVVMLTTFNTDEHVLRALRVGAAGFLLKDTPPADIVAAVRRVAVGDPILSPAVIRQLIAHVADSSPASRPTRPRVQLDSLSEREREVAMAIGQGRSNAEIGTELHMSLATVKTHVSRIFTKLDVNNRVQIALLVRDAGLLDGAE